MKPITVEDMMKDGCSKKFAEFYYDMLEKEDASGLYNKELLKWSHERGFLAESVCAYNLTEENVKDYLSDYDYYKVWPLNSWMRIWVNDKLTLKYMLAGTKFDGVMPQYYFYSTECGLKSLIDNAETPQNIEGLLSVLKSVHDLACKPANGTGSGGFFHLEFDGENYKINDNECEEKDVEEFVITHPNYVFTEYLLPQKKFAALSNNRVHTMRLVVLNEEGNNPSIVSGYFRFATQMHGEANYIHDEASTEAYNIYTKVDLETGEFGQAYAVYNQRVEKLEVHPESGEVLSGVIDNWGEIKKNVLEISKFFFGIEWLGFDVCIDSNGKMRIMEINTHPGIKIVQLYEAVGRNEKMKRYFEKKMTAIDTMESSEKEARVKIPR